MNDIKTIDDLFDTDALENVSKYVQSLPLAYGGWHSNKSAGFVHWNYDIAKAGGKNISAIDLPALVLPLWEKLKGVLPQATYPIRNYVNVHTYGVEGYVHTDSQRADETTAVIYLSKEWRREWAGATQFYQGDEVIKAVMPKYGRVSCFPATIAHAASPVSRICPVARIVMAIKTRSPLEDAHLMDLEDFLREIGAHKKRHGKGSLMGHLVRTYETLKAAGEPREVCLAGGLHSVYGTRHYPHPSLSVMDQGIIRERFGADVEALVFEFSELEKLPDPKTSPALAAIAAANRSAQ